MSKKKTERIFTTINNVKEFLDVVKSHGDKTLYRWLEGNEYVSNTYSEFYAKIIAIAKGYQKIGLSGKRIAIIGETSVEWVASYLATLAVGGVVSLSSIACIAGVGDDNLGVLGEIDLAHGNGTCVQHSYVLVVHQLHSVYASKKSFAGSVFSKR